MAVVNVRAAAKPAWLDVSRTEASMPAVTMTSEQGRELARLQVQEMIRKVQTRAREHRLDRGLTVSLPYFDDQTLEMKTHNFDVIPAGRIMFVPAFVVLAARKELVKVEQDTRLNRSTRKHLSDILRLLLDAFEESANKKITTRR